MLKTVTRPLRAIVRYEFSAPVNLAIVVLTGGAFAAQKYWISHSTVVYCNNTFVDRIWCNLGYDRALIVNGREPWRLLTANLVHTANWWRPTGRLAWIGTRGLLHVAAVVLALLLFGPLVERVFGHRRFAVIYAVSGVAGYALLLIRNPGPYLQGGATGAVYGTFASFLIVVLLHRREAAYAGLVRPAIVMFLILAAGQYGWNEQFPHLIHVGGFAAGIVLGLLLDPRTETAAPEEVPSAYQPVSYPDLQT